MSFETVITISAITEIIALSAISLIIINAFSHGALLRLVPGQKKQMPGPDAKTGPDAKAGHDDVSEYRRAA